MCCVFIQDATVATLVTEVKEATNTNIDNSDVLLHFAGKYNQRSTGK